MLEFFKFIVSDFWVFLGFIVILYTIGEILSIITNNILNSILILKGKNTKKFKEVKAVEMNIGSDKNDNN